MRRMFLFVCQTILSITFIGLFGHFALPLGSADAMAQEKVVVPSERVTRFVNIRRGPFARSDNIGRLNPNNSLPFIRSVPRWHEVRLNDTETGFVSKSWTNVIPVPPATSNEELRIHFLSVGAGTCTVVECPGPNAPPMIIDCGSTGGRGEMAIELDAASETVQRILAEHNAAPNVVLSHGDKDHYFWVPHVLGNITAQNIWQGGEGSTYSEGVFPTWIQTQQNQGANVHRGFPAHWHNNGEPLGDDLSCGLASTFVLTVNSGGSKNTDSLVLMIEYEDFTAIFPGDAVGITEEFARANFSEAVKASVLAASHHGAESHNSNSPEWVAATSPKLIVYSSGQSHGHPRCDATKRYETVVSAAAPSHETHCNDTNSYAQRQLSNTSRAAYVTDVVGSLLVTSIGRSPMKLSCDAGSACNTQIDH